MDWGQALSIQNKIKELKSCHYRQHFFFFFDFFSEEKQHLCAIIILYNIDCVIFTF